MKNKFLSFFLTAVVSTAVFCQSNDKPKNIILLIGDGMGMGAVSSSVLLLNNDPFKKFQSIGFSVTCSADALITDSAAGATALASGYKAKNWTLNLSPEGKELKTIFNFAKEKKYSTGIVATISFTNATPAAFYAHSKSRDSEVDITKQFLNSAIDVSIAGGSEYFFTKLFSAATKDSITFLDSLKKSGYSIFDSFEQLENNSSDKIFAALDNYKLPIAAERNYSLGDMTNIALEKLSKNKNGFVLMIEGSLIDKAAEKKRFRIFIGRAKRF
jgi:alkaline phosphatase